MRENDKNNYKTAFSKKKKKKSASQININQLR